jgi:hypothetical protein
MGIYVAWINEQQETLQDLDDFAETLAYLSSRWSKLPATVCLRFVVPWDNTVFNQMQIPHLLDELRAEAAASVHARVQMHLEKLIKLVEAAQGTPHTYIKFVGD